MKLGELLQERDPTIHEVLTREARDRRMEAERTRAMLEVMSGSKGDFWDDVHEPIYEAVRRALADVSLEPDECWAKVMAAVHREGLHYAAGCAADVD